MLPVTLSSVPNFRDMGGLPTAGGARVRRGWLYRTEALSAALPDDLVQLNALGIGLICDLRGEQERLASPHRLPQDWAAGLLVAQSAMDVGAADLVRAFMRETAGDADQARAYMLQTYRALPQTFAGLLGELFAYLLETRKPVMVNCAAGKDRTGFVCAMMLTALDVAPETIVEDYLASDRHYGAPRIEALLEARSGQKPSSAIVDALRVQGDYLEAALAQVVADHGSLDRYLESGVGLDRRRREQLRALLVEG